MYSSAVSGSGFPSGFLDRNMHQKWSLDEILDIPASMKPPRKASSHEAILHFDHDPLDTALIYGCPT